jgi:hypothetical protein
LPLLSSLAKSNTDKQIDNKWGNISDGSTPCDVDGCDLFNDDVSRINNVSGNASVISNSGGVETATAPQQPANVVDITRSTSASSSFGRGNSNQTSFILISLAQR